MATSKRMSRRRVLKTAGAAAVGGGAAMLGGGGLAAHPSTDARGALSNVEGQGGAPAVLTNTQGGRRYRAFVKSGPALPEVIELTARPLSGNAVLLRCEAAQTCYTSVDQVLIPGTPANNATVVGHGGVGVVEAIGPQCMSVRVGDRVIVNLHDACGRCYNCLRGRSDKCVAQQGQQQQPIANMANGTPVMGRIGGMAELLISTEEYCTPIFSTVSSAEISMLTCVAGCGLGMTMTNCPVDVASDVVIFGGGPVGLSAVMGAKLKGASRIILVEPIAYRRELALKLGATDVVDPNQYRERKPVRPTATFGGPGTTLFEDALVIHLRELTKMSYSRPWAGSGRIGPDHIIEAVGGDRLKPRVHPQGPDPTGVTVLQQCWELCSEVGTIVTSSVGQPSNAVVQIPAAQWADGSKHHWPGTGGGTNDRRDSPRHVRLMETGQIDMKVLAARTYPLSQTREAYQVAADRDVPATIVAPNQT